MTCGVGEGVGREDMGVVVFETAVIVLDVVVDDKVDIAVVVGFELDWNKVGSVFDCRKERGAPLRVDLLGFEELDDREVGEMSGEVHCREQEGGWVAWEILLRFF